MADRMKKRTFFRSKAAGTTEDDAWVIPANTTISLIGINITAPSGNGSIVKIFWDGTGNPNIRAIGQQCLYVPFPRTLNLNGNNAKMLTIRCDNTDGTNAAFLGAVIYYEEHS